MRLARELRLIPVVAIAAAALFVLKTSAIVIEGGYTLIASRSAQAQGLGGQAGGQDCRQRRANRRRAAGRARRYGRGERRAERHRRQSSAIPRALSAVPGCAISIRRRPGRRGHHRLGRGAAEARAAEGRRRGAPAADKTAARAARHRAADDVGGRARGAGKPAAAPPGAGGARARDRGARQPAQGRREAHRAAPAGTEGYGSAPHRRAPRRTRPRPPSSRASSPCTRT